MGYGDALLVSGHARLAQQKDPRKILVLHQRKPAWSDVWEHNPRIVRWGTPGDFQLLYGRSLETNMRPYHLAKTARRWHYNLDFRPEVGELYFSEEELQFASRFEPYVIIEPNIKPGASPNKDWGWDRWHRFSELARNEGIKLFQLGMFAARRLANTTFIETKSFRLGCAVLSRAKAFVGSEGGLHHAAAALNIPGVVIFGGFTPVELTGYQMHRNLGVSLGNACGMRLPCSHCHREMAKIPPERVIEQLKEVMRESCHS